jgi:hypothetical protein
MKIIIIINIDITSCNFFINDSASVPQALAASTTTQTENLCVTVVRNKVYQQ